MTQLARDEGLRKEERLRKQRDFQIVAKDGIRRNTRNFLIIARRNELGFSRVGAVASKKMGNAVERNRVKRLVREFFRRSKDKLSPSTDYIIVGKRGAQDLNYALVVEELHILLEPRKENGRRNGEMDL